MQCRQPATGAGDRRPAHILVFPYPAQGHLLPLLDLLHHLSVGSQLTITVITTPGNLPTLSPILSPTIQALTLPFPGHPSIPPGVDNIKDLGGSANPQMISALTRLSPGISSWFRSHPDPPVALISDFFLGWTTALAGDLGIPRIAFFCSGAFLAAVMDHCWTHIDDVTKLEVVEFAELPGSPAFRKDHLPSIFQFYKRAHQDWDVVKDSMLANLSSFGCIFNSFEAVERKYLNYLKERTGHDRVYTVGPVSLLGSNRSEPGPSSPVFEWLDTCPEGSVLYVCFGSQAFMSQEQAEGLAGGLEKSGARFVWVVNHRSMIVPAGFEERVSGRGFVRKGWAPQARILGHEAVGGFLSHCGWNSVLEGMAGGVAFLTWPMGADQYINARLLVEELRVGLKACEGGKTVPDPTELARVISEWGGASEEPLRARAKELRDEALGAVGEGGTSKRDLDRLGIDLLEMQVNGK